MKQSKKGQFIPLIHRPNPITTDRFLSLPSQSLSLPSNKQVLKAISIQLISRIWTTFISWGWIWPRRHSLCQLPHWRAVKDVRVIGEYWGFLFHQRPLWIKCSSSVIFSAGGDLHKTYPPPPSKTFQSSAEEYSSQTWGRIGWCLRIHNPFLYSSVTLLLSWLTLLLSLLLIWEGSKS